MFIKDYFPKIEKKYSNIFFSGISFNSSQVKKRDIFFAIKGNLVDGNSYIPNVIKKGCKIIVTEERIHGLKNGVLYIHTKNVRKSLAEISFKINNKTPQNLIAVTGTNGKSSVADFYYQILKLNNKRVASIGTLGVKSKNFNLNLSNTTTDPLLLSQILKKLKNQKVDHVIMEASSHGLKQNRLDGLKFNSGIFTNFSQDHLDYHKNLKSYLTAKLYLFENLIKKNGNVITDEFIPEYKKIEKITLRKSLRLHVLNDNKNNFKVLSHTFRDETQSLKIKYGNTIKTFTLNLIGKIQLRNIFMAIIAAKESNLNLNSILGVLPKITSVEGRFEKIGKIKNNSKVILDYAHTPAALKTCLLNIREQFPDKKIYLLFGCGGDRDQNKRAKMGKVASKYSDEIYLTDDNPRSENQKKIRNDIKKGINGKKIIEISNRKKAIIQSIKNLNTGEILIVAGKGHETAQYIGKKKIYFSDKRIILNAIREKNKHLSSSLKLNIIKETSGTKKLSFSFLIRKGRIDSKEVKKNDIFFAIKGKKNNGNRFVDQSFKKGASLAIVNKFQKKLNLKRQIKVKNTLNFLTKVSKIFRKNIDTKIIAITGSCGKTTLKELLGNSLKKLSKLSISLKSHNNKYGVPLSLFNLEQNDDYGVLEVGMDKKGEIDYLSKILEPDVSVITNINYAHIKNFKSISHIAAAKGEIINNTKPNGFVVLNADDKFFKFHQNLALKKNLKVISFGIKNLKSDVKFFKIKKIGNYYKIYIKLKKDDKYFLISNNFQNNIYNVLASLAVMSIFININKLNKNIFLNFKIPEGRGNSLKLKINNKFINLIDESYNSNPLSLKSAILNYNKINSKKSKKYLLLGDMLELGSQSKRLHESISSMINQSNIDKVFVKGKKVIYTFKKIFKIKKGRILKNKSQIIDFIENELNNNDYLMIKASNATGFNNIVKELKGFS